MTYVPVNVGAYVSAYTGAISGMTTSGWLIDPTRADYDTVTKIAGAFAQSFDTVWANATPLNNLETQGISQVVSENFAHRSPSISEPRFLQASNWNVTAAACAALILQSDAYFAGQGIDPGTPGGGGDGKVLVDGSDTTAGFLIDKLAAGVGIALTVLNPGANEQLEITVSINTDAITNNSTLQGATLTDALNNIQDFNVFNTSSVPGGTVEDALQYLFQHAGVQSFDGRQGAVNPQFGDYGGNLVTNNSSVPGTTVEDALNHIAIAGYGVSSVFTRTGNVTAQTGDYKASQITNDASVAGAHVSDALNSLQNQITNLNALTLKGNVSKQGVAIVAVASTAILAGAAGGQYQLNASTYVGNVSTAGAYAVDLLYTDPNGVARTKRVLGTVPVVTSAQNTDSTCNTIAVQGGSTISYSITITTPITGAAPSQFTELNLYKV